MSNTKVVKLKLQCPKSRMDLYTAAIIMAYENHWRKPKGKLVVHSGKTMVKTTLEREVSVDRNIPEEQVWTCHPEDFPFPEDAWDERELGAEEEFTSTVDSLTPDKAMDELVALTQELDLHGTSDQKTETNAFNPVSGWEKRPYSLEELQKFKWTDIQKLGACLGVNEGNRQERELKINELSSKEWPTNNK